MTAPTDRHAPPTGWARRPSPVYETHPPDQVDAEILYARPPHGLQGLVHVFQRVCPAAGSQELGVEGLDPHAHSGDAEGEVLQEPLLPASSGGRGGAKGGARKREVRIMDQRIKKSGAETARDYGRRGDNACRGRRGRRGGQRRRRSAPGLWVPTRTMGYDSTGQRRKLLVVTGQSPTVMVVVVVVVGIDSRTEAVGTGTVDSATGNGFRA